MSRTSKERDDAPNLALTEPRQSNAGVVDGAATAEAADGTYKSDMVFAVLLFVMASTTFVVGDGWGSKAWFFPNVIATAMFLCGFFLGIHGLLRLRTTWRARPESATSPESIDTPEASGPAWLPIVDAVWFIGIFFAYVVLLPITGYIVTTALFYLVVFLALGLGGARWGKRVVYSVLGAAVATTALVMMFEYGFGVPLPGT